MKSVHKQIGVHTTSSGYFGWNEVSFEYKHYGEPVRLYTDRNVMKTDFGLVMRPTLLYDPIMVKLTENLKYEDEISWEKRDSALNTLLRVSGHQIRKSAMRFVETVRKWIF